MEHDLQREKLLIIHLDDMGMSYAANRAGMDLLEKGIASSASIIMPGAWAADFVKWSAAHPQYDIGIHSALTCEWEACRWQSLSHCGKLADEDGFLPRTTDQVVAAASLDEIEQEIRAQIEMAIRLGLNPSHLDNHMWTVQRNPTLFALYLKLAAEYGLVAHIPNHALYNEEMILLCGNSGIPTIHSLHQGGALTYREKKQGIYEAIRGISAGLHILTLHPVVQTEEIEQIIPKWEERHQEYLILMEEETAQFIQQEGIKIIDWQEVKNNLIH